jgi:hypothetical protein
MAQCASVPLKANMTHRKVSLLSLLGLVQYPSFHCCCDLTPRCTMFISPRECLAALNIVACDKGGHDVVLVQTIGAMRLLGQLLRLIDLARIFCCAYRHRFGVVNTAFKLNARSSVFPTTDVMSCCWLMIKPWFRIASVSTADRPSAANCCSLPLSYTTCHFATLQEMGTVQHNT